MTSRADNMVERKRPHGTPRFYSPTCLPLAVGVSTGQTQQRPGALEAILKYFTQSSQQYPLCISYTLYKLFKSIYTILMFYSLLSVYLLNYLHYSKVISVDVKARERAYLLIKWKIRSSPRINYPLL